MSKIVLGERILPEKPVALGVGIGPLNKLNIGPDTLVLPEEHGWVNLDIRPCHEKVRVIDVRQGIPYANDVIEEIYAGNFFDHLSPYEGEAFLREALRVLRPGGKLRMSMMDMGKILNSSLSFDELQPQKYRDTHDAWLKLAYFLLGNLGLEEEYMGHKMLYTFEGFCEVATAQGWKHIVGIDTLPHEEPWTLENPKYKDHCFYVELTKEKGEK